jgi:hypothetical protein
VSCAFFRAPLNSRSQLHAITAETLARTADGVQNTAISNTTDAITAETLARTTADGLKTQLFQ